MTHNRIKVKGIRRDEIDIDQLALVYWMLGKRAVEEKRRSQAEDRKKRAEARQQQGHNHAER